MTQTYRAIPTLLIDDEPAPSGLMEDILQLVVEESLHRPCAFTLVLQNDYQSGSEQPWRYQSLLQIGKPIKIGFSTGTTEAPDYNQPHNRYLLEGEITAIETQFSEKSQAPIFVRGYDVSHRLHRGMHNRSFQNMTDSDIVKKIAAEVGIKLGAIADSSIPHDYVFQENQTNMDFLRERAARLGFELFMQDGQLHFRKPKVDGDLRLRWLTDLHSFRVRVTSAEQVKAVEVRAWDYGEKRAIVSTRNREQVLTETQNGTGSSTSTQFNGKPSQPTALIVDQPVFSPKEADLIAQAVCDEVGGQYVCADARGEGNASIRPGRVIQLDNMGPHSGQYYVTDTRHVYQERVYRTEFSVRGLRGGVMPRMQPHPPLQPGQTLLVGIVTDNEDPEGWGRVKVKFPTLTEDHASNWARVVAIGAANARGFDCLPEINDEVLVAFEHGDIHRPYVLGGVWNGKDAPPAPVQQSVQNGKVRLRTFQTRAGHQLQFVDDDNGSIHIKTAGGQDITLKDGNGSIQVSATGAIDLSTAGKVTISGAAIALRAPLITSTTPIQPGL